MPAVRYNLVIEQGASFSRTFRLRDRPAGSTEAGEIVPLAGSSIIAQCRRTSASAETIFDLGAGAGAEIDFDENTFTLALSDEQTAALTIPTGAKPAMAVEGRDVYRIGVYDVKRLLPGSEADRVLEGDVFLALAVTR